MEKRSDYVLWFEECDITSIPLVGGKNASLGELLKAQIPVPPGFAITTRAYTLFLSRAISKRIFLTSWIISKPMTWILVKPPVKPSGRLLKIPP